MEFPYIAQNIEALREKIEGAAASAGRKAEEITLVAVTKTVDTERIRAAVDAGIAHLGENRVQEYLQKKDEINGNISWHLIGQMQTNKVKYIIGGVSLLQSMDRLPLAREIERQCEKSGIVQDTLIEINIAGEETKAGFETGALDAFLEEIDGLKYVRVKGLMTVAPFTQDKAFLHQCFEKLRLKFESLSAYQTPRIKMEVLSMGMSGDFEEALQEGSNMIRIGSAIFGARSTK